MGGRSAPDEDAAQEPFPLPAGPAPLTTLTLSVLLLIGLVANVRPIGAGDTRATEHVAASLVRERDFDLDEYPAVEPPFARDEAGHRVSIYPVLSAVLAAPVFAAAGRVAALDENGTALAGKLAAALLSALAAGVLFVALALRHGESAAAGCAALFAFGTSVWSTSQALWQHPAAVLFLCWAVLWMVKAEYEPVWAGRVGLPLGLALAARHADAALVAVLAVSVAARWPRRIPALALWGLPGPLFVLLYDAAYFGHPLRHGFSGSLGRFSEPWGVGHLGLLLSPAKGLLVFTPLVVVAAVGLARSVRSGERWLPLTLGGAALAHWLLIGRWSEWHGGESWGPRLMTDALPPLFLFLPEGFDALPRLGRLLAALSVAVQALGAFSYDYRWERLHRPLAPGQPELWSVRDSPLVLQARERVVILALPSLENGRVVVREHPLVPFGPTGSRIGFAGGALRVGGGDATAGDVHLQHAARLDDGKLRLKGRWDGLFLRVLPGARPRRLELRITGRGRGTLHVGERSLWSPAPRWTDYPMDGAVRIRHPYYYPESGGPDLIVTVGKSAGEAALDGVALVPPDEPDNVLEAPPSADPR